MDFFYQEQKATKVEDSDVERDMISRYVRFPSISKLIFDSFSFIQIHSYVLILQVSDYVSTNISKCMSDDVSHCIIIYWYIVSPCITAKTLE